MSSEWMTGLQFAEAVGADSALDMVHRNEFRDDDSEFAQGVYDYIDHHNNALKEVKDAD